MQSSAEFRQFTLFETTKQLNIRAAAKLTSEHLCPNTYYQAVK